MYKQFEPYERYQYAAYPTMPQERNDSASAYLLSHPSPVVTVWAGDTMLGAAYASLSECYPSYQSYTN